ncbi:MAG: (Fe-S)-binding protein [Caldilineaceae bacterium]|nr:(Fe-S)-binding protein [Caldilineaceae bacterium]
MQKKTFKTPPRRVALFVTCMVDMLYPGVGIATVELLERHGIEVIFPQEQTCCGQPAFNAGYREEARTLARRFLQVFGPMVENGNVDAIVAPSGSCTTMTSHFYSVLFEDSNERGLRQRAEFLAASTFELTEFLVDVLGIEKTNASVEGKITYHPCCHLYRELGIDRQPRTLLANVEGAEIVDLPEGEDCCGFGGLFAVKNSEISGAMGRRKAVNLDKSGADVVAMCDVSCLTHINGVLSREGIRCRAVHIAEVLNGQLGERLSPPSAPIPVEPDHPRRWMDSRSNAE